MDKQKFFEQVKENKLFLKLSQSQVEGMEAMLDYWEKKEYKDIRWLAYILGTVYHESARTMKPVEEIGKGAHHEYGKPHKLTGKTYYGRGRVQLTHYSNYLKFEQRLKVPLTSQPELMLTDEVDLPVLFDGMTRGLYTGVGLMQFLNNVKEDYINARRIVNGLDRADLIAKYAKNFLKCLS